MDAKECIKTRRSVRQFTNQEVTDAEIKELVELTSYSPSWKNKEPVRFIAVKDPELKKKIAEDCVMGFPGNTRTINNANVLIVEVIKHGRSGFERDGSYSTKKEDRWEVFDAGIWAQTFMLSATEKGLATVLMGIFDEDLVHDALGLDDDLIVASLIALGHPDEDPQMPRRRSVDDLLSFR